MSHDPGSHHSLQGSPDKVVPASGVPTGSAVSLHVQSDLKRQLVVLWSERVTSNSVQDSWEQETSWPQVNLTAQSVQLTNVAV